MHEPTYNESARLFDTAQSLTYVSAREALQAGYVLLLSRVAFSSTAEMRQSYPPHPDQEADWEENVKPWCEKRRHMFLACMNPVTGRIITSSSGPDNTHLPWIVTFFSEGMPLTQLDMNVCQSPVAWDTYNVSAVALSSKDYSPHDVADAIQNLRENRNPREYSTDPETGYGCQTATRDLLSLVNRKIDPKTLMLPDGTDILAYYSEQVSHHLAPDPG